VEGYEADLRERLDKPPSWAPMRSKPSYVQHDNAAGS